MRAIDTIATEEEAAAEAVAGAERKLRDFFRDRVISFGTMDRGLRSVTALALVAIVAAAILVGLRETGLRSVPLASEKGLQSTMPEPSFWLTVLLLAVAWSYVLGGLLHAHRIARLASLGAFTFATYELWSIPLPLGVWRMVPSYVALALVWVVGLAALYNRPGERGDARRLRPMLVPLLFLLVLAVYLTFWWRLRPLADPRFYTLAVYHQLEISSFALMPVLLVAGVDFAEWGDAAASRATALSTRVRWSGALPSFAALSAAGVLGYCLATTLGPSLWRSAGLAALFAVLVGCAAIAARRPPRHVPYATVFASSLALMGVLLGISYSVATVDNLTFRHPTSPHFQISYPANWQALPSRLGAFGVYVFLAPGSVAQLYVVHIPSELLHAAPDPRSMIFKGTVQSVTREGLWRRVRFNTHGGEALSWQRRVSGGMWLVVGVARRQAFSTVEPVFERAWASWTPVVSDAPTFSAADRAIEGSALAWLGVAAAASAALFTRRRRDVPGWLTASFLFAVVAGLYYTLVQLPTLAYTLFGASSPNAWPSLTLKGLETLVAGTTLLALATRTGRRAAGPLITLNLGLFAVDWLDRAISGEIKAGRMSVVQAVLILIALVWDVVMSGEAITNRHNRHFPRHTRVLVYLGYVIAVSAAVLFFSSIRTARGSVEPLFESEGFADWGLLFLGTSLLVTLCLLRLGRLRAPAPEHVLDLPDPSPNSSHLCGEVVPEGVVTATSPRSADKEAVAQPPC